MYNCKKATELVEKEQLEPLSFITKMRLKMHLMMCSSCSNYKVQSKKLSTWIKERMSSKDHPTVLSEGQKKTLIKKIEKKRDEM